MEILYSKHNTFCDELPDMVLPYWDITLVLSGDLRYEINGIPVSVNSGDAIIFRPGDMRKRSESGVSEYYSINFTAEDQDSIPSFISGVVKECVSEDLKLLLCLYDRCIRSFTSRTEEKCENYLKNILLTVSETALRSSRDINVEKIKRYVALHLREEITLSDVASEMNLSPNYCTCIFRQETGMPLIDYIIREKMQHARFEVLQGSKSLPQIAAELGYTDYSYFSRVFKKCYGVSPSRYRKQTPMENDEF